MRRKLPWIVALLVGLGLVVAPPASAVGAATLTPTAGPPTTATTFAVTGFGVREAVDVYVDTTVVKLVVTDAAGAVSVPVVIPASAVPGAHWLTAVGRKSGTAAQATFTVRTDWTRSGFDLGHTGQNPYENVLSPTTVAGVRQRWRTPVPGGITSTPAVVAGVAYVSVGDGSVRAFDVATGAQRWTRATGGSVMFSSPAVVRTTLYVGSSDDKLYALNTANGAVRWSAATGDLVYGSPVVVGNTVYVGSYDDRVYAFDATTGAARWSFLTGGPVFASPTVADGVVYVGSFDASVYALSASTGTLLWSTATTGLILAPTIVVDAVVYGVSEGGDVFALRADDGTARWTVTGAAVADSAGFVDGLLVVADTSGVVRAYNAASGGVRWATAPPNAGTLRAPVTAGAGVVYVGYDSTFALRASDGALLRTLPAAAHYGSAAVVDGTVVVGDYTGRALVAYALPNPPAAAARPQPGSLHR